MDEIGKNILQTYLRRLTNLSGNNRSLLLLKLHVEQLMDLHEASQLNGERSFSIINALIAGKEKELCQIVDSRLEANNEVSKKLKKLERIDKFIFEERGSNDLHVGWPFVRGKFMDGTWVRCPLLFFPVTLIQENNRWILRSRKDAGITLNKAFLLAYAHYNHVKIDEELIETSFEDFNADSTVFRTEIYQLLKEKLELNFNADNFRDELISFEKFKSDDFDQNHRNGEIKLFPEAVLGIFPQAGSQLVPDYVQLIEEGNIQSLDDVFLKERDASTIALRDIDHPVKEEKLFTPFSIDAYQERAIIAIKNGHSIVVQGPPGTGKSQLICNLMADAIAAGKRVLLVCQKRAALDVVYKRLKETELGDFLGLVHDFRNDRKEIFAKIARQIDRIDEFKSKNRSIDAIQLERRFFQCCRRIDQLTEELDEFKKALFDVTECGISVKELYLTSALHEPAVNIKQEYQYFNFFDIHEFIRKLTVYTNFAAWFELDEYAWRDRKSFADFQFPDLKRIENILLDIPRFQQALANRIDTLISMSLNLEEGESFLTREAEVMGMMSVLKDDTVYTYFQKMIGYTDDETSTLWFANTERVLMSCFEGEGPESTIPSDQLGVIQSALLTRMDARKNLIRRIKWEFFSDTKFLLKRILVANDLPYSNAGMAALEKKIDSRLNLEHNLTSLRQKEWLINLPKTLAKSDYTNWFNDQRLAMRAKIIFGSLREVKKGIHVQSYDRTGFIDLFRSLLMAVKKIPEQKAVWSKYLSGFQIRKLIHEPNLSDEFITTLRKDFDNLCEFDRLKDGLKAYEKDVLIKLYEHTQSWDAIKIVTLFNNSIRLAWIDHIETKYPILRAASSVKMDGMQTELRQHVEEKTKISGEILMIRAREKVYERVEYNRLNNRITYRDLHHQVAKKKKIWPVRKLISEFQDEIFNILPCWLASPESVSAIFPMKELFDLVIFDEASQCFAERGIPAMYRGKQLLIAGDDKQLRPNELYQVRWEEEGEHPDQEIDSLLELGERYLSTVHLQGHYRSRSLELIDFSNQHFYEGRLRLLPDREHINQQQPAIEYCKVDGVWENQTNLIEAEIIIERVCDLIALYPEKEIGIVTFNVSQQELILDMLEEALLNKSLKLPESLFVKNIENVQGDEKDIIIFSTGYAPDSKKKMMMQFGSLNQVGGENRLNVAVTRAREKVILVTSIWPEQLKVEELKNEGPKLLRKYLEFARDVHEHKFNPRTIHNESKSHAWYLNDKLKQWANGHFKGMAFETNALPFSDLNFKIEEHYLGVLLTDDMRYYEGLSAKDSFAYTPALLNEKNWRHRVIFSRNFWQNKQKTQDELSAFVGLRG